MGQTASHEPPTQSELLARFSSVEQRMLLRNASLLAAQDPSQPAVFGAAEWAGVHASMEPRLAGALFCGFARGEAALDSATVVQGLVALREQPESRLLFLVAAADAIGTSGEEDRLRVLVQLLGSAGSAWLKATVPGSKWEAAAAPLLGGDLAALPPPPPAGSRGAAELAAWAAGAPAASAAAAAALAQLAEAAWLSDHRQLQPLPELAELPGGSLLLSAAELRRPSPPQRRGCGVRPPASDRRPTPVGPSPRRCLPSIAGAGAVSSRRLATAARSRASAR